MSIEDLRTAVRSSLQLQGRQISIRTGNDDSLSEASPAAVFPIPNGYEVVILDSLEGDEAVEAEAHEFGHILLRCRGLIEFAVSRDPEGFFRMELNNALSHRLLVDLLRTEFLIGSNAHLDRRRASLATMDESIRDCSDEPALLHGIGLQLFDIERTFGDSQREDVSRFAARSPQVSAALEGARQHIADITCDIEPQEQIARCQRLLDSLAGQQQNLSTFAAVM